MPSKHAYLLIGYLPIPVLDGLSSEDKSYHRLHIYHHCIWMILESMMKPGRNGIMMQRSDGSMILAYLILMSYITDILEQCRAAVCRQNACPTCLVTPNNCGKNMRQIAYRDTNRIMKALREDYHYPGSSYKFDGDFLRSCYPSFWKNMPHTDILQCFTPDLLHQIHKDVFKSHAFEWALALAEKNVENREIDCRFIAMTEHPSIQMFPHGVSSIKQWTGAEAKVIMKVFVLCHCRYNTNTSSASNMSNYKFCLPRILSLPHGQHVGMATRSVK